MRYCPTHIGTRSVAATPITNVHGPTERDTASRLSGLMTLTKRTEGPATMRIRPAFSNRKPIGWVRLTPPNLQRR